MYRYSERLAWSTPPNRFSALLTHLRAAGRPLFDLTVSNPSEALAAYPHLEIANAFKSIQNYRYQPEPFGLLEARQGIVGRAQKSFPGLRISPAQVALTASTSEAYALLFKLLANPGDEMLVPTPSYPLFEYLAQLEAVKLKPYTLNYDGSWFIDFASLEYAVSPRTRAIILVNPNNPTGSFLKRREFFQLRDFSLAHSLPLIADEVFTDYAFADSEDRISTLASCDDVLTFTLNGLSKAAGMPQMKLGWITVNGPLEECQRACAHLELVLDTYLSVGTPVQLAAERLLIIGDTIRSEIQTRIRNNLSALRSSLADQQIHMLHCEGGWSAILRVPSILHEEEWVTRLAIDRGVIVQPGYFFDMPNGPFLVISLLTNEDIFAAGLDGIKTFSAEL